VNQFLNDYPPWLTDEGKKQWRKCIASYKREVGFLDTNPFIYACISQCRADLIHAHYRLRETGEILVNEYGEEIKSPAAEQVDTLSDAYLRLLFLLPLDRLAKDRIPLEKLL